MMMDYRLYLVTDRTMLKQHTLTSMVKLAAGNGVSMVQYRDKQSSTRQLIDEAYRLKEILAPMQVPLIINDRVDVALAVDAEGVHLGQQDMPVHLARKLLGREKVIGLSVETQADMERAMEMDVDYLGVSPVFLTPTKTDTRDEWGLEGLRKLAAQTNKPLVAIGGMHLENAAEVIAAGADGIAVVSEICAADDPGRAAAAMRKLTVNSKQ